MGKWTPGYVDDVLHHKIKDLVHGAIKRTALDKTEPTISYENFVNDLDIGDSFTTSLIEILVKELAERRTRPTQSDRRLIADRSAKSLRLLATPPCIYYGRSVGRTNQTRRMGTLSDYVNVPPVEIDTEEDEDFLENVTDPATIERIRTNLDLYDAYVANDVAAAQSRRSLSPDGEDAQPSTSSQAAPARAVWTVSSSHSNPATSLTRQPSIRRPARSRTVDFNDFTLRRRSTNRENQLSLPERDEFLTHRELARNSQTARRFFPFARSRRNELSADYVWGEPQVTYEDVQQWFDITPPLPPVGPDEFMALSDERARSITPRPSIPRLRRGGLRAPESILSRHTSPVGSPLTEDLAVILPSAPRHPPNSTPAGGATS